MVSVELEIRGLVELERELERKFTAVDDAVRRALAIVAQRGHDYLLEHAPVLSGDYRRSVALEITPAGDVKLSISAPYAKAVAARQGIFNAMIKATMSPQARHGRDRQADEYHPMNQKTSKPCQIDGRRRCWGLCTDLGEGRA